MRFFIRCQALGFSSFGAGVTKKIAKHTAAEKLLNKYFKNEDDDVEMLQDSVETNCISDLLDYCVVKGYPKPEFECVSSCGPSHAPTFTFKCKLNSIEKTAEAKSKQLAKQLSAKAVYNVIKMVSHLETSTRKTHQLSVSVIPRYREESRDDSRYPAAARGQSPL
jgi:dsRNA-specific ribonuclease